MFNPSTSSKFVILFFVITILAIASLGLVAYSAIAVKSSSSDPTTSATTSNPNWNSSTQQKTITVPGVGVASAQPDQVQVVLGVINSGPNASLVLTQNDDNMSQVISSIENGLHVNSSDIQTTQFNFGPQYGCCNTITGYQASNTIQITLPASNASKLDAVINAAIRAGANQIQSIQYVLSSSLQNQLKLQALERAVADANQTALQTALSENVKIIGIQSVVVIGQYQQPYPFNSYGADLVAAASVNYSVPLAPGQTQYTMNVQVTYLLG